MKNCRTTPIAGDRDLLKRPLSRPPVQGVPQTNQVPSDWIAVETKAAGALLLLAVVAIAYSNSFAGTFVFDDVVEIKGNRDIRQLWPPWSMSASKRSLPIRPIPYFTFALNYATHGDRVWGYHAVNLAIHAAAALLLLGIVRRTLRRERLARVFGRHAEALAFCAALLWAIHPLHTQAVTYIYQRIESLMGLFFLATLYAMIRAVDSPRPIRWYASSVLCCLLGMASKEVMVVAPLVILWYDAVFISSPWYEAIRRRWPYYLSLFCTWVVLGGVLAWQASRYSEFKVPAASSLGFALTQPAVVLHYLSLSFWPYRQCLDYAWPVSTTMSDVASAILVMGTLLALTLWAVIRRPALGFLAGSFFLILAPTSSVFPVNDLANEHRMYLPLAALVAGVVCGVSGFLEKLDLWTRQTKCTRRLLVVGGIGTIVIALALTTHLRNRAYASRIAMWNDVVEKAPHNARAYGCLAEAYLDVKDYDQAARCAALAVQLDPNQSKAHNNLGLALAKQGNAEGALFHYRDALRLDPQSAEAHLNLGNLIRREDPSAAIEHFRTALRFLPSYAEAHNNLGAMLSRAQPREALDHYVQALRLEPGNPHAYCNLANLLVREGRFNEALDHYQHALAIDPEFILAKQNLAVAMKLRNAAHRFNPTP